MLESIKEILIEQIMHELQERKQIEKEISALNKKEKNENFNELDKQLDNIEEKLKELNKNKLTSLLNNKLITKLNSEYMNIASTKIQKLEQYNSCRNNLLTRLHAACHDQAIMEQEIKRIENAKSLEELNLTNEKAEALLRKCHNHEEISAIQQAFSKISSEKISTKEEIEAKIRYLYQSNASSFYVEMSKITPNDFAKQLIEIGIEIDKNKLLFLEKFALSPNDVIFSGIGELERSNHLDIYFGNEAESILNRIRKYPTMSNMALSQLMSLAALISMAKQNCEEKRNKK